MLDDDEFAEKPSKDQHACMNEAKNKLQRISSRLLRLTFAILFRIQNLQNKKKQKGARPEIYTMLNDVTIKLYHGRVRLQI